MKARPRALHALKTSRIRPISLSIYKLRGSFFRSPARSGPSDTSARLQPGTAATPPGPRSAPAAPRLPAPSAAPPPPGPDPRRPHHLPDVPDRPPPEAAGTQRHPAERCGPRAALPSLTPPGRGSSLSPAYPRRGLLPEPAARSAPASVQQPEARLPRGRQEAAAARPAPGEERGTRGDPARRGRGRGRRRGRKGAAVGNGLGPAFPVAKCLARGRH